VRSARKEAISHPGRIKARFILLPNYRGVFLPLA